MKLNKTNFIQIRISERDKRKLMAYAKLVKMNLSELILSKVLSEFPPFELKNIYKELAVAKDSSYHLAALNDLLMKIPANMWVEMVSVKPENLDNEKISYVASMIDRTCELRKLKRPSWIECISYLDRPRFGSDIKSLRLYLLISAPVAFRRRNIFVDSSIGDRI